MSRPKSDFNIPNQELKNVFRIGYDTIKIHTHGKIPYYQHVKCRVEEIEGIILKIESLNRTRKIVKVASVEYGWSKIRFYFRSNSLSIEFEPSTFFYPDNSFLAGEEEVRNALMIISGLIQIPIDLFSISRMDITANFKIDKPLGFYTDQFHRPPRMKLQERYKDGNNRFSGNVYYAASRKGSNRSMIIYDKKGMMRIELKFLKELKRTIRKKPFKCESYALTLCDKDFFSELTSYYAEIIRKMCRTRPECYTEILRQLHLYELANQKDALDVRRLPPQDTNNQVA